MIINSTINQNDFILKEVDFMSKTYDVHHPHQKFPLGQAVVTPGVFTLLSPLEITMLLSRHARGD